MKTVAVLPIKRFTESKQRLTELSRGSRMALMTAMVTDVLIALRRCKEVDEVIVVTGDESASQIAVNYGAFVVADPSDLGHSQAAGIGVRAALTRGAQRVLLVPSDCPAINPKEIDQILNEHPWEASVGVTVVPDREGLGTNALIIHPPTAIAPAFGSPSLERHVEAAKAAGATVVVAKPITLLMDVDVAEDVTALRAWLEQNIGGASHTRGILPRLLDL